MAIRGNHIGSVYIKVRPDAKDFRRETERDLGKELDRKPLPLPVEAEVKLDELEREVKKKLNSISSKMLLKVGHDHDSLNDAVKKIEQKLKDISKVTIEVDTDEKSLREALGVFKELRDEHPVEVTYNHDEQGFQRVLSKIAEIRAERTAKTITFDTDEESLARVEDEMNHMLERFKANKPKDPLVLLMGEGYDGVSESIKRVQAELDKLSAKELKIELDKDSLEEAKRDLEELRDSRPVVMRINHDEAGYRKVLEKVREIRAQRAAVTVEFDVDDDNLDLVERQALTKIQQYHTSVNAISAAKAEAILDMIGRDRWVELKPRVQAKAAATAMGALTSLAGLNTVRNFMEMLEDIVLNFDTIMIQAGTMGSVIGTAFNFASISIGAVLTTLRDMGEVFQLVAMAPTLMLSAFSGWQAWTAIWGGFEAALLGIPGALEKLPPQAQRAVGAIEDLQDATKAVVQDNFWGQMNDEIYRFIRQIGPSVTTVMSNVATEMGRATSNMMTHLDKLVKSGQVDEFVKNNTRLFHELGQAAEPFFEAFMTLGIRGSKYLPVMGREVQKLSETFRDFISEADRLGKIDMWIRNGTRAFRDMISVGVSVSQILGNITDIFDRLNVGGLYEMAQGLRAVEQFTRGNDFQWKMQNIFAGAKDGAAEAARGISEVIRVFYKYDEVTRDLLRKSGELAGEFMSSISAAMSQPILHQGLLAGFDGMIDFVRTAQPAFEALARTFGRLGEIGGEVAREIGPGLTITMRLIDGFLERVGPAMAGAVEPLTRVFEDMAALSTGPLFLAAEAASLLLKAFTALPGPLQNVVMLMGMMSKFGVTSTLVGFFGGLGRIDGELSKVRGSLSKTAEVNARTAAAFGARWGEAGVVLTRVGRGISGFFKNLWALAGGWVGIGIGALVGVFTAIAGQAAKAEQKAQDLKSSLDQVTAAATATTKTTIFDQLTEQRSGFSEFFNGEFNFEQIANDLGYSVGEIVSILAEGGHAAEKFAGDLNHLSTLKWERGWSDDELRAEAERIGFMGDVTKVTTANLVPFAERIYDVHNRLKNGRGEIQSTNDLIGELGGATREASPRFQELAESMSRVQDEAADADSRVRALLDTISMIEGKDASADQLRVRATEGIDRVMSDIEALAEEKSFDWSKLFDSKGLLDLTTTEGARVRGMFDDMVEAHSNAMMSIRQRYEDGEITLQEYNTQVSAAYEDMKRAGNQMADELGLKGQVRDNFLKSWNDLVFEEKSFNLAFEGQTPEQIQADIEALKQAGISWSEAQYEAILDVDDNGVIDKTERSRGLLEAISRELYFAYLDGDIQGIQDAYVAAANIGFMWNGEKFIATLDADGKPTQAAIDAARKLGIGWDGSKWVSQADLDPKDAVDGAKRATASARSFANGDYDASLDATDNTGRATSSARNGIATVKDKHVLVGAGVYGLSALATLQAAIAGVRSKSVTIAAKVSSSLGSIWGNADGSMTGTRFKPGRLNAFADGGFNYTSKPTSAHIAPAGSYTLFAERETGGEAYIPLSSAKRERSLAIWKEVGKRFNVYSDGGVSGSGGVPRAGMQVHVTNHYPQAEPTSVTTNKALEYAAALGLE